MRLKLLDFQSGETLYQARLNYQLNEDEEEIQAMSKFNHQLEWSFVESLGGRFQNSLASLAIRKSEVIGCQYR